MSHNSPALPPISADVPADAADNLRRGIAGCGRGSPDPAAMYSRTPMTWVTPVRRLTGEAMSVARWIGGRGTPLGGGQERPGLTVNNACPAKHTSPSPTIQGDPPVTGFSEMRHHGCPFAISDRSFARTVNDIWARASEPKVTGADTASVFAEFGSRCRMFVVSAAVTKIAKGFARYRDFIAFVLPVKAPVYVFDGTSREWRIRGDSI